MNSKYDIDLSSTADAELAKSNHEVVKALRGHRKLRKLVQSYGENWLKHLDGEGLAHPNWRQMSTVTGRMSCNKPNMQQIPRDGFRQFVVPRDKDGVFIVADYSQIELRIAAKIAGETKMLEAYERGEDLHTLTAKAITDKDEVTKDDRQLAKAVNFGLLYGMGAGKLQTYAKQKYNIQLSEKKAKLYRDRWLNTYPKIKEWHKKAGNDLRDVYEDEIPGTRTLYGRIRSSVDRYSERLNSPVQGSGADGLKLALTRAAKAGLCPVLAVHDELVCEVDAEIAESAKDDLEKIMREAMQEALRDPNYPDVPIEVEPEVKDRWAK